MARDPAEIIRLKAEADLESFIRLVHPGRVLGNVHVECIRWMTREEAKSHQLVLLPRDHQKSALAAYRCAWEITRNPAVRILYISSTARLAIQQIKFIKDILTSDIYTRYWPNMVNKEEAQREKWAATEFSVDHPLRKTEAVRDPTVFTAGLTSTITGMHCDIAVLDDVVVLENAYTEEGREKVRTQYSLLASIESGGAKEWVVGTRYHPLDLYNDLMSKQIERYDPESGKLLDSVDLFEFFQRQVEDRGDGTGQYLWPRQQRADGKWFGFNFDILQVKKAQYLDLTQFRAQYYNDPNDITNSAITRANFQYYDPTQLKRFEGKWYIHGKRLNVFAAIDFAFSLSRLADYTSIVVVGVAQDNCYYVLDIDRFKTQKISDYFEHIMKMHTKWDFRKIRCEITSAQEVIVKAIKEDYIKPYGLALAIDEHRPNRYQGSKEERCNAILQPRYANMQMWHYPSGLCQILEEELLLQFPPHDDVKDCLAAAIDICVPPSGISNFSARRTDTLTRLSHSRFGGLSLNGR